MGLLQDEFKRSHGVLELVALERFALNLVDARQDLLEAPLEVFDALSVHFLHLLALLDKGGVVFGGYLSN